MENYLKKLEYDKILNLFKDFAVTDLAKKKCLNLTPSFNKKIVETLISETSEALNLEIRKGLAPINKIEDINLVIKKIESNICLSAKELLDIANVLKQAGELKDYFYKDENFDISTFSFLNSYFSSLYTNIGIENKILDAIIDKDTISDNASQKLSSLRKNRKKIENDIKDTLNKMIHSSNYSKYIMEQIITIKNDRYVIPVKEEFRGMIKGFIHDMSASGSTLFIEPISIFEMNNSINNIKFEEQLEIQRILEELSSLISPHIFEIMTNVQAITNIDFAFAKANFAKSYSR